MKLKLLLLMLLSASAEARVFSFSNVSVSSYLKAVGGTSNIQNDAYIHGNGGMDNLNVKEGMQYEFGGEFGFSFDMDTVTARIGVELLRPQKLSEYAVKNSSEETLYNLTSDVVAYSPALTIEWSIIKAGTSKTYLFTGGGYSYIKMINTFDMTSTGTTTFGKQDYVEDAKTTAIFGTIGFGFETLMVDNVTVSFELGYRHLEARRFKMRTASDGISGSYELNDTLKNSDGTDRRLIMSQPFAGILFKFYI